STGSDPAGPAGSALLPQSFERRGAIPATASAPTGPSPRVPGEGRGAVYPDGSPRGSIQLLLLPLNNLRCRPGTQPEVPPPTSPISPATRAPGKESPYRG